MGKSYLIYQKGPKGTEIHLAVLTCISLTLDIDRLGCREFRDQEERSVVYISNCEVNKVRELGKEP